MATKKFYITTPIYYPNRPPHIGSAYTTVIADIFARYYESLGYDVFYLTGTDEHGMKLYKEAKSKGLSPLEYINQIVPKFKAAWEALNIKYHRFIRTTDEDHEKTVQSVLQQLYEKGDIYKGTYSGLYCVECEQYYTPKDLIDGKLCPIHLKPVERLDMEVYFFRLSKYEDKILELLRNTSIVRPEDKKNYLIRKIEEEGLNDVAISRPKWYLPWGIPCPWDENHVIYVWIDALLNYISGIGYLKNPEQFKKFWPPDVQLVGKDIIWFHGVIWPIILMALGLDLPKVVYAHGFLTVNGMKISKSLGTDIDPIDLVKKYGADTIRYYLARAIPFGLDGDFSEKDVVRYHNTELVNEIGNLTYRVFSLVERYFGGIVPEASETEEIDAKTCEELKSTLERFHKNMREYSVHHAVTELIRIAQILNGYLNKTEPWKLWKKGNKKRVATILRYALEGVYILNAMLYPFMPSTASRLAKQFGLDQPPTFEALKPCSSLESGAKLGKKEMLFKKLPEESV